MKTDFSKEVFIKAQNDGKTVVVYSWNKYCVNCNKQKPILKQAKKDFNDLDTSKVIEAVKIDKAFEQIDKVTEFVKESLQDGNEDSAIKALEFIKKL